MGTWSGPCPFEETLLAAGAGDEQAFASMWRWLHPSLIRYLRAVSPAESEDLASEVWLSVVQGLRRFRGDEGAFRAWAFTIARHRVIDAARRRSRRVADNVPLADVDPPAPLDAAAEADARSELEACLDVIRSLPAGQADVVALRVIGGLSVPETAAVVGKSDGAVRVLAHRGLRQLAEQLSAEASAPRVTR
jgi:RNA polymerase sigma-70 factor (ECF subfamily)